MQTQKMKIGEGELIERLQGVKGVQSVKLLARE